VRLLVVAAGKVRDPSVRAAIDEYLTRAGRLLQVDEIEVKSARGRVDAQALLRPVPPKYEVWALDAGGVEPTSAELAAWLEDRMNRGRAGLALVLGSADGLPSPVLARAHLRLSLSRLTLPHGLARLIVAEQIYRALTMIRGQPYAR
jgi:23S rRNA (pseudouridine1915-N3)-methyltransferase